MLERKTLPISATGLEIKAEAGQPVVLSGYASTFGGEPDSYNDVIAPNAYAETIMHWQRSSTPLPMLFNHNPDVPIGVWPVLLEDTRGLVVQGELTPGSDWSKNVEAGLRHRSISGLSIGFRTLKASEGPSGTRILEQIQLHEISAVTFPANRNALVTGLKSANEINTIRDLESLLRDQLGWSRREAEAVTARVLKSLQPPAREERATPAISERRDDGSEGNRALAMALRELRGLQLTNLLG